MQKNRKICLVLAVLMAIHFSPLASAETIPEPSATALETPAPETTAHPEVTALPSESVIPEETPAETEVPSETETPSETEAPSETEMPSETEIPSETETPSETEIPSETVNPTETPIPEETAAPSESEIPGETVSPTETPSAEDQNPTDVPEEVPPEIQEAERDRSVDWRGAVESDEQGLLIPMLFQFDYQEIVLYYNGIPKSVATSGCGATSVSMVIAYLTGNTEQNPYSLFCAAVDDGRYHGNGLSHSTLKWLAEQYGVYGRWVEGSEERIVNALREGKPVIAHMGEGAFTEKGHYIVLRGLTEDGKVLVNDPASRERSHMAFPISSILDQARASDGFMICSLEPEPEANETAEPESTAAPVKVYDARFDVNGSGDIDLCDAQLIYDIIAQPDSVPAEKVIAADVNGDGIVNEQDILCILEFIQNENGGGAK